MPATNTAITVDETDTAARAVVGELRESTAHKSTHFFPSLLKVPPANRCCSSVVLCGGGSVPGSKATLNNSATQTWCHADCMAAVRVEDRGRGGHKGSQIFVNFRRKLVPGNQFQSISGKYVWKAWKQGKYLLMGKIVWALLFFWNHLWHGGWYFSGFWCQCWEICCLFSASRPQQIICLLIFQSSAMLWHILMHKDTHTHSSTDTKRSHLFHGK